jgi:DNA invertase Pin-like site-specific DNA recombinase
MARDVLPPDAVRVLHEGVPMKGAIAAYVRVSTAAQDYEHQVAAIDRAAKARGEHVGNWYAEKCSSTTLDRPELARLRADVRAGMVRKVYVFRIDRLARVGIGGTLRIVEELRDHGAELVTVADGFDLRGPAADVVLAVMAWAAKMERLALMERTSAARERIEAAGGHWGRPRRVIKGETLARARELRETGHTIRYCAQALKVPRATLARALSAVSKAAASQRDRAPLKTPVKARPRGPVS